MRQEDTRTALPAADETVWRAPLRGAVNFRDLGGVPTRDGRVVAGGRLYRSDSLAELTPEDLDHLKSLELKAVYDLRHPDESRKRPNRLPPGVAALNDGVGFHLCGAEKLLEQVAQGKLTAEDARKVIADMYAAAVTRNIADARRAVAVVLKRAVFPALIHCTAGKDRTGLIIMMTLTALGAPREAILADYLISDRNRKDIAFLFDHGLNNPNARAAVEMMRSARPEFLSAAFDGIDRYWGGDEKFLTDGLGIDPAAREALRNRLLA